MPRSILQTLQSGAHATQTYVKFVKESCSDKNYHIEMINFTNQNTTNYFSDNLGYLPSVEPGHTGLRLHSIDSDDLPPQSLQNLPPTDGGGLVQVRLLI